MIRTHHSDPSTRVVRLHGAISAESTRTVRQRLAQLRNSWGFDTITLKITSLNGTYADACDLHEILLDWRNSGVPIRGLADERCGSTAVMVLLGCAQRLCTERAHFVMRTPVSHECFPRATQHEETDADASHLIGEIPKVRDRVYALFGRALDKSPAEVLSLFVHPHERTSGLIAQDAVRLGIVGEIVPNTYLVDPEYMAA